MLAVLLSLLSAQCAPLVRASSILAFPAVEAPRAQRELSPLEHQEVLRQGDHQLARGREAERGRLEEPVGVRPTAGMEAAAPSRRRMQGEPGAGHAGVVVGGRRACDEACYQWATCNEELGRCDCPKHRAGPSCARNASAASMRYFVQPPAREAAQPLDCLSGCSGRGACVLGACVCDRGHWGSDCSLSWGPDGRPALLAGRGHSTGPRARRPHVYVYDLPHKWSSWFHPKKVDRATHWSLWERLLSAGATVADGEQADWYFLPLKLRSTGDGPKLQSALTYVRQHWPWFDRLQGHRHFVLHTGDSGRGEVQAAVRAASANVTWLHHFGLTADYPYSGWTAGHRPGKDVVVPILFGSRQGASFLPLSPLHPRSPPGLLPRDRGTLLFVGRICGDGSQPDPAKRWPHCATQRSKGYSQGARQWVHYHHHNRSGFKIATRSDTYPLDFMSYRWCLAPSGGGHGHRQALAAAMGCLPVVVSDSVLQPFEPEMDWSVFGLRVAHEGVPSMHQVLAGVDAAAYEGMQDAVRCAAQHLLFSSISGAVMQEDGRWDAFETILEILRMQQLHPGLDPAQYGTVDERFRTFMACGAASMQEYGTRRREVVVTARLGGAASLVEQVYGKRTAVTWDLLYGRGLNELLHAAAATPVGVDGPGEIQQGRPGRGDGDGEGITERGKKGLGRGEGEDEGPRLCSASLWDPKPLRCSEGGKSASAAFAPAVVGQELDEEVNDS